MTPLPPPLGDGGLRIWRLDRQRHAATWDSGEGAFLVGGRWNSRGHRVIYCALDPATAILEVAVHKGFAVLDTDLHVMTSARLSDPGAAQLINPEDLPNPNWLAPGVPSAGQQGYGDELLRSHPAILVPSVVSRHSWNMVLDAGRVSDLLDDLQQEAFALDPRLHPPLAPNA